MHGACSQVACDAAHTRLATHCGCRVATADPCIGLCITTSRIVLAAHSTYDAATALIAARYRYVVADIAVNDIVTNHASDAADIALAFNLAIDQFQVIHTSVDHAEESDIALVRVGNVNAADGVALSVELAAEAMLHSITNGCPVIQAHIEVSIQVVGPVETAVLTAIYQFGQSGQFLGLGDGDNLLLIVNIGKLCGILALVGPTVFSEGGGNGEVA